MKFLRPEIVLSEISHLPSSESPHSDQPLGSATPGSSEYVSNHIHMTAMAAQRA